VKFGSEINGCSNTPYPPVKGEVGAIAAWKVDVTKPLNNPTLAKKKSKLTVL
jgi:hypothetical protein